MVVDQPPRTYAGGPYQASPAAARILLHRFHAALVALVILGAILFRVWLIARGMPRFDSDEGTMGLMALHIENHGELPAVFYGQAYMGALEAYLAAAVFHVLGPSDLSLRLGLVGLYALFLVAMYLLLRLLHGPWFALAGTMLLGLGSQEVLSRQLKAVGGYPEILAFGALLFLIATYAGLRRDDLGRRQLLLFGAWGLVAGLALWSDALILPFVLASAALLVRTTWPAARGPALGCLLAGLLLGFAPLIAYNATTSGPNTIAAILDVARAGGSGHTGGPSGLPQRIAGLVAVSIPVITGGNGICTLPPQDGWPLSGASSAHTIGCTAVHAAWGTGVLVLGILAALIAASALRRVRRQPARRDRREETRALARLALLSAAALTVLLFLLTRAPAVAPWYNVRYLTPIWIALPEIVAPLPALLVLSFRRPRIWPRAAAVTVLGILLVGLVRNTAQATGDGGWTGWANGQEHEVNALLLRNHVDRMYSDYWVCDWLAFETRERVICAALDNHLRPGLDRYRPYRRALQTARDPGYVFLAGTPQAAALARFAGAHPGCLRHSTLPLYVVYLPAAATSAEDCRSIIPP
jgi:hypothetical protein